MNHKPKGVTELVLEISTKELGNGIQNLAEMIDNDVRVEIESDIVRYNVQINAHTERPIVNYQVDQSGVVHIAEPEPEQLEAELGLPEEKPKIEEKPMEIKREVVDQFIIEGMAPEQEGFPENMADIAKRRIEGESYRKLATELEMSSSTIVDLINDYRAAVARSLKHGGTGSRIKPTKLNRCKPRMMKLLKTKRVQKIAFQMNTIFLKMIKKMMKTGLHKVARKRSKRWFLLYREEDGQRVHLYEPLKNMNCTVGSGKGGGLSDD